MIMLVWERKMRASAPDGAIGIAQNPNKLLLIEKSPARRSSRRRDRSGNIDRLDDQ
ncbi:hypothetical protein [Rhizorhabdus wittichii]|jgi:hypothetical protein